MTTTQHTAGAYDLAWTIVTNRELPLRLKHSSRQEQEQESSRKHDYEEGRGITQIGDEETGERWQTRMRDLISEADLRLRSHPHTPHF